MARTWLVLTLVAAVLLVIDGGKYAGMIVLTALMPIYSLLLASIFFMIFLAAAAIAVPIGDNLLNRVEAREAE